MILRLENIYHRFVEGEWELHINRLVLSPSKNLAIIGPNGSGKTTLLRIAAGILSPLKGEIWLQDKRLQKLNRRTIARHLGYLPQEVTSEYDYAIEDIVCMGRYPYSRGLGTLTSHDFEVVHKCLRLTELEAIRKRRLSRLSSGEKKRAFLASVLAQEPKILLLDEPTNALDIHHQVQFFHLLKKLSQKGIGIAVVTHDINMASLFSNTLMFLAKGKCLAIGPADQVLYNKTVREIYGKDILMGQHPETGQPTVLPRLWDEI